MAPKPKKFSHLAPVRLPVWLISLVLLWPISLEPDVLEADQGSRTAPRVVDYQHHLPRSFKKRLRDTPTGTSCCTARNPGSEAR